MTNEELTKALTSILVSKISTPTSTRSGKVEKVIHISDLYSFCFRKYILAYKNDIPINTTQLNLPISLRVTFGLGYYIERMVLKSLYPYLVGQLNTCKQCGQIKYNAPLLAWTVGDYTITGHPDGIVKLGNTNYIIDVKSIDKDRFKDLDEANLENQWQIRGYLYLKRKLKLKIGNVGFLIYVSKGHNQMPIKVFPVTLNKVYKNWMDDTVKEIETFSKNRRRIPKMVCSTELHPLARTCPVKDICFKKKGGKKK